MRAILENVAAVGSGGFLGAVARYGLSGFAHQAVPSASFPVGTLVVNTLGCLLIGLGAGLAESRQMFSAEWRAFAFVGVLGGFTTFSTFGFETFAMLRDGQQVRALANVGLQVGVGFVMVWLGYTIASWR